MEYLILGIVAFTIGFGLRWIVDKRRPNKRQKIWVVVEDIPEINDWSILRIYGERGSNVEVDFFNMSKENRDKATEAELQNSKRHESQLKSIDTEVLFCNPLERY